MTSVRPRDFGAALGRLRDPGAPTVAAVRGLSSPSAVDARAFAEVWPSLGADRRSQIAREMLELAEADFEVDFKALFVAMLTDDEPSVRATAVDGLWESLDVRLVDRFTTMMRADPDALVRGRAAAALGTFVEQAELGRLASEVLADPTRALLAVAADAAEDLEVRRRAIESAGYADYEVNGAAIEAAYASTERLLRVGALRAMGRSADDRWAPHVTSELDSSDAELRFEAARAAGELCIADAVPRLVGLAADADREIRLEAIWSLGEIGGAAARRALERIAARAEDDDLLEALEDALATCALADEEMFWGSPFE